MQFSVERQNKEEKMRTLKLLQVLCLSVLILLGGKQRAEAFFLIPPLPFSIEVDIPNNAGKLVSNLGAIKRVANTVKTMIKTKDLEILKKGGLFDPNAILSPVKEKNILKVPGKGTLISGKFNGELGITKKGMDEKENFNACHTLFFVYPPKSSYPKDYPLAQRIYDKKKKEFIEDTVVDTYLAGRVTEDYLGLVEKTLERLDNCQKGLCKAGGNNLRTCTEEDMSRQCVFFGMQMAFIDPTKGGPDDENDNRDSDPNNSENPGQYGEFMNNYIVSVVYDKIVRIIEDLTAVEAQFEVAKQLNLVEPIKPDEHSDASDYIENSYKFAYQSTSEYTNAKMLGGEYKRSEACQNGGPLCSGKNKDKAKIDNLEDTEILRKLAPIEDKLNEALNFHNLKANLYEYENQYKKYVKAKQIHEEILEKLRINDQCVTDFLRKHKAEEKLSAEMMWYGSNIPNMDNINKYETRSGLSRMLIDQYEEKTMETIIGTDNNKCRGFYKTCPAGYQPSTLEGDRCEYDKTMVACVISPVEADTGKDVSYDENEISDPKDYENVKVEANDTDSATSGESLNEMEMDSRIKAERSWRIGSNLMMDLTKTGKLKFKPWNDQQSFQTEYLRNKYRNIKMIIKALDKAENSYKLSNAMAKKNKTRGAAETLLREITSCKTPAEALDDAKRQACRGYPKNVSTSWIETSYTTGADGEIVPYNRQVNGAATLNCDVEVGKSGGHITGYIIVKKDELTGEKNNTRVVESKIDQRVGSCTFTKAPTSFSALEESGNADNCPGTWNFTTSFLIKQYFPAILANCQGNDVASQAKAMKKIAKAKGRIVASDKFDDVIAARKQADTNLKNLVYLHNKKISDLKIALKNAEERRIQKNNDQQNAISEKNEKIRDRERTKSRLNNIENNIKQLRERVEILKERYAKDASEYIKKDIQLYLQGVGKEDEDIKKPTLAQEIGIIPALEREAKFLNSGKEDKEVYKNLGKSQVFTALPKLDKEIERLDKKIETNKQFLDMMQKDINKKEEDVKKANENFTVEYLKVANENQTLVEEKNTEFEKMIENNDKGEPPYRMSNKNRTKCCKHGVFGCQKKCPRQYEEDHLESMILNVLSSEKSIKSAAEKEIKKKWFSDSAMGNIAQALKAAGVPSEVVFSKAIAGITFPQGAVAAREIAQKLKDKSVDDASLEIEKIVKDSDDIITQEMDAAIAEVEAVTTKLGVSGKVNVEADPMINIHENYALAGELKEGDLDTHSITKLHMNLIDELREPENKIKLNEAEIYLSEILGIPDTIITDDEYFVALPARGKYEIEIDENDGRDYMAPRKPLLNLPPLREVFFYNEIDFDETPKDEAALHPVVPFLLDLKFKGIKNEEVEQLPETWRYILAQPNLREDGKYNQTFMERSFGTSKISELVHNEKVPGASWTDYRAIIVRGGVFPCQSGGTIMDVVGGKHDKVENIRYRKRDSWPTDMGNNTIRAKCYEIAPFQGKVRNLLADFDANDPYNRDKSNALQSLSRKSIKDPMYTKHSELGQFLDYANGQIQYTWQLEKISKYLIDEKKAENSIERQRAETGSFKRNLFGSFLEMVKAEHNAEEIEKNNFKEMESSLENLCSEIHKAKMSVNGETCDDSNDSECAEKINKSCATFIIDQIVVETDLKTGKKNVKNPYYKAISDMLKSAKEAKLSAASSELAEVEKSEHKDKIAERIKSYKDLKEALTEDKTELAILSPDTNRQEAAEAIKRSEGDREVAQQGLEKSLLSMENQSRVVPYCPIY